MPHSKKWSTSGWIFQDAPCSKTQLHRAKFGVHTVQIAKLLIVPFVCLVERFWLQRHFSRPVIASILVVVAGVGIV